MPRLDYSNMPYEGFNAQDVTNIFDSGKNLAGMLPAGFEEEAKKLKELHAEFDKSSIINDMYMKPNDPQVRENASNWVNQVADVLKSVDSRLDKKNYPLQEISLRELMFQTNVFNEGYEIGSFVSHDNGPAYIGYGATRSLCMDISTVGWPENEPERSQFLNDVNEELRNTPLLENHFAGLDQMENMLIRVQTEKALQKDPDNAELQQKLADANAKIAESTHFLANNLSKVSEYGNDPRFDSANAKETVSQIKFLSVPATNSTIYENIRKGRDLGHATDGAKIMSSLLDAGMSADEAARFSRGIHQFNTIGPAAESAFRDPKTKAANREAEQRFPGLFERLSAPLRPENLPGTLKSLEENGLTLDHYIAAAEKEISRALRDTYTLNQGGQMVYQNPGSPVNNFIQEGESKQAEPGANEILPVDSPDFMNFMNAGYRLDEANSACRKIDFIRGLGREVQEGIEREKKLKGVVTDPQAAAEFADLHSSLALPLHDANLPDTMQRLKEQGITLDEYLNAAGEQLCEAAKRVYTPPAQPDDLLGPTYSTPRDPKMQGIVGELEGMEATDKAKRFMPEVLTSMTEKPGQIEHKAFDSPVTNLDGTLISGLISLCGDRSGGGLGAYIPDLSPQTEKRLQELQLPLVELLSAGLQPREGRMSIDPEALKKARPALSELHTILEKEYKRVKEAGDNPIAEVQLRSGMIAADCFANGISFADLDRKTGESHDPAMRPLTIDLQPSLWDSPRSQYSYKEITDAVKKTPLYDSAMAGFDHMDCLIAEEKARRKLSRTENPDDKAKAQEELGQAAESTKQASARFREQYYKFREFAQDPGKLPEELKKASMAANFAMSGGAGRGDTEAENIFRNVDFLVSQGVDEKDAMRYANAYKEIQLQSVRLGYGFEKDGDSNQAARRLRTQMDCFGNQLRPENFQETWNKVKDAGIDFEDYLNAVSRSISAESKNIADSIRKENQELSALAEDGRKPRQVSDATEKALRGVSDDFNAPVPKEKAAEYARNEMETFTAGITAAKTEQFKELTDSNIADIQHNKELLASKRWYGGRFRSNSDEHTALTRDVEELTNLLSGNGPEMSGGIKNAEEKNARLEEIFQRIKDHGEAYLKKNGEEAAKNTTMGKNRSHSARYFVDLANNALHTLKSYGDPEKIASEQAKPVPAKTEGGKEIVSEQAKPAPAKKEQVRDISFKSLEQKVDVGAHYRGNLVQDIENRHQRSRSERLNSRRQNDDALKQQEMKRKYGNTGPGMNG